MILSVYDGGIEINQLKGLFRKNHYAAFLRIVKFLGGRGRGGMNHLGDYLKKKPSNEF